jgi:integrase/recombinase XerD
MVDLSRVVMSGPLGPYAEGFAAELGSRGYAASSVLHHCRLLGHVSRWLETQKLEAGALSTGLSEDFLAERHAAGQQVALRIGSLEPLLAYLRGLGVIEVPHPSP